MDVQGLVWVAVLLAAAVALVAGLVLWRRAHSRRWSDGRR